jgi:signal transduction histidine kinase
MNAPDDDHDGGQDGDPSDILVVDDDASNLSAIEAVLSDLGVRLTLSRSGEDSLRHLLQHDYAVILLDVNLPGMSGFETARLIRARERTRHVPIIFITGYSHDEENIRRGYELGAVDYLFKPIVADVLRAKVKVFVDLRDRTAEVALQAERLRDAERLEAVRNLEEERRRWEAEELRRQIRQQRLLNEQLSEIDRRKDEFIAMLAHELRNPLVPLVMGLRLIASRRPSDLLIVEARDKMERQVTHLRRLVDDLLDVARISQGKLELDRSLIDLREVVEQAKDMCRAEIERSGQALHIEGTEQALPVHADIVRMTQVVSNLLSNASKYSDQGSSISLRWGLDDMRAFVKVTDQGRGIAPEFLDRVFETFAQERADGRGLGLGLALVRELVDKHGGTVEVASEGPGHGSEFTVWLPITEGLGAIDRVHTRRRDPSSPHAPAGLMGPRGDGLRVALIEDDVDIRDLVGRLIETWGHTVIGVSGTGRGGVEILLREQPDVAVVDIGLPDIDGYEVARRVHAELKDRRPGLVAMSGYGQERDRRLAGEAGFDVHLVKPPEPEDLRDALEYARQCGSSSAHASRAQPVGQ